MHPYAVSTPSLRASFEARPLGQEAELRAKRSFASSSRSERRAPQDEAYLLAANNYLILRCAPTWRASKDGRKRGAAPYGSGPPSAGVFQKRLSAGFTCAQGIASIM